MDREYYLTMHWFFEQKFGIKHSYMPQISTGSLKKKCYKLANVYFNYKPFTTMVMDQFIQSKLNMLNIANDHLYVKNPIKDLFKDDISQILEEPPKKKRKKMDDYGCSENLINHLLNDDCLAEIFKYVPAWERPKLALVCKKWNRVLPYSWASVKKLKLFHWRYDDYQSILQTKFTLVKGYNFSKSMLYKCGHYLTELDMLANPTCNMMYTINKTCPFLVKLRLRIRDKINKHNLVNIFSGLSKLKILKLIIHTLDLEMETSTFFNSLLNVADTLNELSLSTWDISHLFLHPIPNTLCAVIPQLKALRKFELFGFDISNSFKNYLKSAPFEFYYENDIYMTGNIHLNSEFKRIQKVILDSHEIKDDFLYNLANTNFNIETLVARCTSVTDDGIVAISKMNKLKHLRIISVNNNYITDYSIKLLKNLQTLELPGSNKITDDSVTKVLVNSPELKFLSVIGIPGVTYEFMKEAVELSKVREHILEIHVILRDTILKTVKFNRLPFIKIVYTRVSGFIQL